MADTSLSRAEPNTLLLTGTKLAHDRQLKIDAPRRGVLPMGGPHAGGGESSGDPSPEEGVQGHVFQAQIGVRGAAEQKTGLRIHATR